MPKSKLIRVRRTPSGLHVGRKGKTVSSRKLVNEAHSFAKQLFKLAANRTDVAIIAQLSACYAFIQYVQNETWPQLSPTERHAIVHAVADNNQLVLKLMLASGDIDLTREEFEIFEQRPKSSTGGSPYA